uniref:glycoside hydrolase family 66 protein n=1 Tax=Spirosoma panaciterrae TaxID=496058 RepID=UPI000362F3B6
AAEQPGYFNPAGVLLTDAVIFAFGGSHLELGEHMLGKEYFPNANLAMSDELKTSLIHYYDFLVAYQNLLRDGGTFNSPVITAGDTQLKLNTWPPQAGQVSAIGKLVGNRQIIHLINFSNSSDVLWRDETGTRTVPKTITLPRFNLVPDKPVKKIWFASPDYNAGAATSLTFSQSSIAVSFTLPSLQYWDMVVVEY